MQHLFIQPFYANFFKFAKLFLQFAKLFIQPFYIITSKIATCIKPFYIITSKNRDISPTLLHNYFQNRDIIYPTLLHNYFQNHDIIYPTLLLIYFKIATFIDQPFYLISSDSRHLLTNPFT